MGVGNNSGRRAQTTFLLEPSIETDEKSDVVGASESGYLSEFASGEKATVTLWRDGKVEGELGTFPTSDRGTSNIRWTVPKVPGGPYELEAVGEKSGLVDPTPFVVEPNIVVSPHEAAPDDKVAVTGTGFDANSSVSLYMNDTRNGGPRTSIGVATTNSKGSFKFTFIVPHVPGGPVADRDQLLTESREEDRGALPHHGLAQGQPSRGQPARCPLRVDRPVTALPDRPHGHGRRLWAKQFRHARVRL